MLKKIYVLSFCLVSAVELMAVPVRAQETSTQVTNQTAAIIGNNNTIIQVSTQQSVQQQRKLFKGLDRLGKDHPHQQRQGRHRGQDQKDYDHGQHQGNHDDK